MALKRSTLRLQIIFVGVTIGLIAFLFLNGRNNSTALVKKDEKALSHGEHGFNFKQLATDIKKELPPAQVDNIEKLEAQILVQPGEQEYLQLARIYDSVNQPALAGYYYDELTQLQPNNNEYWYKTGRKFFEAQQQATDSMTFAFFVDKSLHAYERVLERDPQNLDAKAEQAVNFIEGKNEVMKGVGLLREIIEVNPNHKNALLYLGILSMKSGQYDKAVERFEKLVSQGAGEDANFPFYYRYLGQAYQANGQNDKAKDAYYRYKMLAQALKDPRPAQEADQLLKSIH